MKVILIGGSEVLRGEIIDLVKQKDGDGTLYERIYIESVDEIEDLIHE